MTMYLVDSLLGLGLVLPTRGTTNVWGLYLGSAEGIVVSRATAGAGTARHCWSICDCGGTMVTLLWIKRHSIRLTM
ncbi:hypothetical protein GGR50DRAFT_100455 [Xylaria sp. CBS 124048]|nr:hypothetical protein GGR50DRAFT_100455 [Xylaria sp. CBS 124048]